MKELFTKFLVEILSAKPGAIGEKYAKAAKSWMSESRDVVEDIRSALKSLDAKANNQADGLAKMFGQFLVSDLAQVIDEMSDGTVATKDADRLKAAARNWLAKRLPETAQREVAQVAKTLLGRPTVWVRSATAMSADLRAKLRKEFADKYVIFNIDENLLGGLQVVSDGQIVDASWLGRIKSWDTLKV